MLVCLFQTFDGVGAYVNSGLHDVPVGELDVQEVVRALFGDVIHTVDKCLIHVEDYCFLLMGLPRWR